MSLKKKKKLNCGFLSDTSIFSARLRESLNSSTLDQPWDIDEDSDKIIVTIGNEVDEPITINIIPSEDGMTGTAYEEGLEDFDEFAYYDAEPDDIADWLSTQSSIATKINCSIARRKAEGMQLNSNLSLESSQRIKNVFRDAQEAVDFPKGFRYTAFRTIQAEDAIVSTLMYHSAKLEATQWVIKSTLSATFEGELEPGSDTAATQNQWSFVPNHDPDPRGGDRGISSGGIWDGDIRSRDQFFVFPEKDLVASPTDRDAARWLVVILQKMIDSILENPPARVHEFFLADGLIKKKNLSELTKPGLMRLLNKNAVAGYEVLKAKPDMWKPLVEKGYITGEQALKVQPSQLLWLTTHNYIPVERALKINPDIRKQLTRYGKQIDDTEFQGDTIEELVNAVADGVLTPQRAWSINPKVLQSLVEAQLIDAYSAYKLEPSILNWMLKNRYIGRAEATKLKPRIKQEMNKQGVDWEDLDAGKNLNAARTFHLGDEVQFKHAGGRLSPELATIIKENPDGTFQLRWEDGDISDGVDGYNLILADNAGDWEDLDASKQVTNSDRYIPNPYDLGPDEEQLEDANAYITDLEIEFNIHVEVFEDGSWDWDYANQAEDTLFPEPNHNDYYTDENGVQLISEDFAFEAIGNVLDETGELGGTPPGNYSVAGILNIELEVDGLQYKKPYSGTDEWSNPDVDRDYYADDTSVTVKEAKLANVSIMQ